MADSTFYERRMKELTENQQVHAAIMMGAPLPTSKPMDSSGNPLASNPDGNPNDQNAKEQAAAEMFNRSTFGQMHNHFTENDKHYKSFTDNLTSLAMTLKSQVDNGYMPMAIAQQKIEDFVNDHREGFKKGRGEAFSLGQDAHGALMQAQQQKALQQAQEQLPEAQVMEETADKTIQSQNPPIDPTQGGAL